MYKLKTQNGITLIALVISIITMLILAGVSLNTIIGDNGILLKTQIAKNENEYAAVKEALGLYYLQENMDKTTLPAPVSLKLTENSITEEREQGYVVEDQGVNISDNIIYDRLYYLDQNKLGIKVPNNKYYMDTDTRIVYIHGGIELSTGTVYKLDIESGIVVTANNILPENSKLFAVGNSTYVVKENGDMYGVGEIGGYNQLGLYYEEELYDSTNRPQKTNIQIIPEAEATDDDFIKVVSNGATTYFLKKNGDVYQADLNNLNKISIDNVKDIYLNSVSTAYFIKKDNTLWASGSNKISQSTTLIYNIISSEEKDKIDTPIQISYKQDGIEVFSNIKLLAKTLSKAGTIIVKDNGEVWATIGYEYSGRFGENNGSIILTAPKRLTAIEELATQNNTEIKDIITSQHATIVLLENNEVYSTGYMYENGIGSSTTYFQKILDNVNEIYCGIHNYQQTFALKNSGELYAWGEYIGFENRYTLVPTLQTIDGNNIQKRATSLALLGNGNVYRIGTKLHGNYIDQYTNIQAKDIFEKGVIDTNNYVWLFGSNLIGDKGKKIVLTKSNVTNVDEILTPPYSSNMFIKQKDSTFAAWGANSHFNITSEDETAYYTPQEIENLAGFPSGITSIKKYLLGAYNAFIIDQNDNLWYKGYGAAIGTSKTNTFIKATDISDVKDIFYSHYASMALKNDGTFWVKGSNSRGELGLGDSVSSTTTFTQLTKDSNGNLIDFSTLKKATQGALRMNILLEDGSIYTWGQNSEKVWGLSNNIYTMKPIKITYFENIGEKVIDIIDTNENIVCLTESGNVYVSGNNTYGQLGIGTTEEVTGPQKAKISNVKQIIAGRTHIIVVKDDNSIWAWGNGSFGQLGTEKTENSSIPIPANYLIK